MYPLMNNVCNARELKTPTVEVRQITGTATSLLGIYPYKTIMKHNFGSVTFTGRDPRHGGVTSVHILTGWKTELQ